MTKAGERLIAAAQEALGEFERIGGKSMDEVEKEMDQTTDAPERIWAWRWDLPYPSKYNEKREWSVVSYPPEQAVTEYVRADLHDALAAENARLRDALREIVDLGGVHGGFAYADNADRIARAALATPPSP